MEFFSFLTPQTGVMGAILLSVVVMLLTGRIYPKSRVDELREEINELKATNKILLERGDLALEQAQKMASDLSIITTKFLAKLPDLLSDVQQANKDGESS